MRYQVTTSNQIRRRKRRTEQIIEMIIKRDSVNANSLSVPWVGYAGGVSEKLYTTA